MSTLSRGFRAAPPDVAAPRRRWFSPGYGGIAAAPSSPEGMLGMSAVYACVRKIATGVGTLPLHVYRKELDGRNRADGTSLYELLHDRPNRRTPPVEFWTTVAAHLAGWGNCMLYKEFDGRKLIGLWPIHPSLVSVELDEFGEAEYVVSSPRRGVVRLPETAIVHIRVFSLDGVEGLAPLTAARRELMTVRQEDEYRDSLIRNRAQPEGVLTTDKELSPKASGRVVDQWKANHGGSGNGGVALLEGGMRWVPMSITPADAQWVENRQLNIATVARLFGLPVGEIEGKSGDSLTYKTVEGNDRRLLKALLPYIAAIESALKFDRDICPRGSLLYPEFNVDAAQRAELAQRAAYYSKALDPVTGWMNRDEVRPVENLSPDPEWQPQPRLRGPAPADPAPADAEDDTP